MAGLQAVTVVCISGAFVFGMVLALLGSIKLSLARRLDIGETRVAGLLAALNFALIPMMLLSGVLIDKWGPGRMLILGSLTTGIAIFCLSLARTYWQALAAILLVGLAGACVSTGSVVLMPKAFWPDNEAASLNLGNVFFGLGALVTPALADLLLRTLDFRKTVGILGLVCLIPACAAALAGGEQLQFQQAERADLGAVMGHWTVWLAGLVFFLYGPLEWSIATWATTYLTDLGWKERRAAWLLSGFWLTFLSSRLLMGYLQRPHGVLPRGSEPWVILVMAMLAAIALGNLAGAHSRGNAGTGLLLLGAAFGPIFPTLVGVIFNEFPPQERGTAYGAMFALGSIGGLVVPPVIGNLARRKSVQFSLRVPAVMCMFLTLAALVLGLALTRN